MVITEHSTEPIAAVNIAPTAANFGLRIKNRVVEPLVISLGVVMGQVLLHGVSQGALAEENQSIQALRFQQAEEPLEMSVQVWTLGWQSYGLDAFVV